jgi:hypothetical protein
VARLEAARGTAFDRIDTDQTTEITRMRQLLR